MRTRNARALIAGLLALALLAGMAGREVRHATTAAEAADNWNVQVGGDVAGLPATAIGFFPSLLEVHVGDTVIWNFVPAQDPHTVSFLGNQPPPGDEFIPQPDGSLVFGESLNPFGPVGPNATYDGTVQISSGIGQEDDTFRLTFTKAGIYGYICLIHGPSMQGIVRVDAADATLPETPDQARARGLADLKQLFTDAMEGGPPGGPPAPMGAPTSGPAVIPVAAGATLLESFTGNLAGLLYQTDPVTVHQGDTVVWTQVDPLEIHTVTFTSGAPPPDFIEIHPQPEGPPQLVVPANVAGPVGGPTYNGQGYVNSGILNHGQSFVLTITAPPGSYDFLCLVHPTVMKGRLVVAP